MKIEATPEEIAALVAALQERREPNTINFPVGVMCQAVQKSIDDTGLSK